MVFLLVTKDEAAFKPLVEQLDEDKRLSVAQGVWLIQLQGSQSPRKAWNDLVGSTEQAPNGILVQIADYYGYAPKQVWDWIAERSRAGV